MKRTTLALIAVMTLAGCGSYSPDGRSEGENAAALLLLGIASFGAGYTSGHSRVTCMNLGGIITCD